MRNKLLIIALLFLVVRGLTIYVYEGTYYYYGMVANQFAIAEASYRGQSLSLDEVLVGAVFNAANQNQRYIPIEEWKDYPRSDAYTTFPAQDVPGFGYLIAFTSQLFGDELTSRYAFTLQVLLELVSILLFVYCVSLVFGQRIAFISGLLYIFAYPFIWPVASQPMRDIFVMGVYSFYLTAFFVFAEREGARSFLMPIPLIVIAALLLWVRPSAYYFFFISAPLVLFLKNKDIKARAGFLLVTVLVPLFIFGLPLKAFNVRHYGVADTDMLGRALWAGMGIIKDNPYVFVLDDGALVPWCKSRGYIVKYASPEMNKILGDYARDVIREDPEFYLRTVLVRAEEIVKGPLGVSTPRSVGLEYKKSGISLLEYVSENRESVIFSALSLKSLLADHRFGLLFFHLGWILSSVMFFTVKKDKRLAIAMLVLPLYYTLLTQLPLHFEARYLAAGAWVLILPFAWFVDTLVVSRVELYLNHKSDLPRSIS